MAAILQISKGVHKLTAFGQLTRPSYIVRTFSALQSHHRGSTPSIIHTNPQKTQLLKQFQHTTTTLRVSRGFQSHIFESYFSWMSSIFHSISNSTLVNGMMNLTIGFHDCTQLPWYLSIMIFTVLMRFSITLPLSLYQVS